MLPQNERRALPVLQPNDATALDQRARERRGKIPNAFSAGRVKSTPHVSRDRFSRLPGQLLLQINKSVLNTTTRV